MTMKMLLVALGFLSTVMAATIPNNPTVMSPSDDLQLGTGDEQLLIPSAESPLISTEHLEPPALAPYPEDLADFIPYDDDIIPGFFDLDKKQMERHLGSPSTRRIAIDYSDPDNQRALLDVYIWMNIHGYGGHSQLRFGRSVDSKRATRSREAKILRLIIWKMKKTEIRVSNWRAFAKRIMRALMKNRKHLRHGNAKFRFG